MVNTKTIEKRDCSNCGHCAVCFLSKDFKAAQEAVNNLFIPVGDHKEVKLCDMPNIMPVVLECVHYLQPHTTGVR